MAEVGSADPVHPGDRIRLGPVRALLPVVLAATAGFAVLAWLAIEANHAYYREREGARLEAMADLRAGQVAAWLGEKAAQAEFAGKSPMGELYVRWRAHGDEAARIRLLERMHSLREAAHAHAVVVLDDEVTLSTEPAEAAAPAPLREAVRAALARNAPAFTPMYGHGGPAPAPRIDVATPFRAAGPQGRAGLALRLDPEAFLFPILRQWPLPSRSASALLVQREGESLVGPRGKLRLPADSPGLLTAEVLSGRAPMGRTVEARDFRGVPVLGVVRAVPGTDLLLVAKIDAEEAFAEARRNDNWIIAAAVMAWLAVIVSLYLVRERRALRLARLHQSLQDRYRQQLEQLVQDRTSELASKNEVLQRAVGDLEAFGYSLSHDLRGPLRTISGFATMLERSERDVLSERGRHGLRRIAAGVHRMDRMIEDILSYAHAQRLELRVQDVALDAVVREVLADLAPHYPATRIEVKPLPRVRTDPTAAGQVMANLIGNALKFSARQPSPHVEIGALQSADGLRLYVQDNGVGFDMTQADKLFAPFQRLHGQEEFAGTGVGLSIVKRLIERQGGTLQADSSQGRTVFSFTLGTGTGVRDS